jgi:WD40 repeat protein
MGHPASAKHENLATMPHREIKVESGISEFLHLPGGQQVIICSRGGSFRVWDLERDTQVGEKWEDAQVRVRAIALSPSGKTIVSGSWGGIVKLWNVDTGKVIKILKGHTKGVKSVCWNADGGRVVSGSWDGTFIVWDIR